MAEEAIFSLASKVTSTISSPAFSLAYETASSIWGAKDAVERLKSSIEPIKNRIQDAEEHPKGSILLERLKEVLYDAEDLFDSVATNELLKQNKEEDTPFYCFKKVTIFLSSLNPIISGFVTATEVNAIRQNLDQIYKEMEVLNLKENKNSKGGLRIGTETQSDVGVVIGREIEKNLILEFINAKEFAEKNISVIGIVGIGGMGKSTLAQYVYNDQTILNEFSKDRMWWAHISSDTVKEVDVAKKIYSSITHTETTHSENLSLQELQSGIKKQIGKKGEKKGKFFLVLDDLWGEHSKEWDNLLVWLSSDDAKGSKVIITTRNEEATRAIRADKTCNLEGLTHKKAWEMFRKCAFENHDENDLKMIDLGKKIMEKCANVPLAIKCVASLLQTKTKIEDWQLFLTKDLASIDGSDTSVLSILKLSYYHLPQNLKHCFAYCYLYKKGSQLSKQDLIYQWIAHGYVDNSSENPELEGLSYFNELVYRSFFQREQVTDSFGNKLKKYKMHDLNHDLAQHIAGKETSFLTDETSSTPLDRKTRHISVSCKVDESWKIPQTVVDQADRIRSFLFMPRTNSGTLVLDKDFMKLRFVRVLNLEGLNIKEVPESIKKFKHIRYLNLSKNIALLALPNSITKLVNLLTLNLSGCKTLKELPRDFRKLISLRHLDITNCQDLVRMPSNFEELSSLKNLSDYKVSIGGEIGKNGLEALAGMKLIGSLKITYDKHGGWSKEEMRLKPDQISEHLKRLSIHHYPNVKIPIWWRDERALDVNITRLQLHNCNNVTSLPPLRYLPLLKQLYLEGLTALEYVEDEDVDVDSNSTFFLKLKVLELTDMMKLVGWSKSNSDNPSFQLLTHLVIHVCNELKMSSRPSSPLLEDINLRGATKEMVEQLAMSASLSKYLNTIVIIDCNGVKSFLIKGLASLRSLEIRSWRDLEEVEFAPNAVRRLTIRHCAKLKLWDKGKVKTGKNSLAELRMLCVDKNPNLYDELPLSLRQREDEHKLTILQLE